MLISLSLSLSLFLFCCFNSLCPSSSLELVEFLSQPKKKESDLTKIGETDIKVFPGPWNHGIFITLPDRSDEEYQVSFSTLFS